MQIFPIHYEPRLPASHQYVCLSGRAYMSRLSAEKVGLMHPQPQDMLAFATIANLRPVFHQHGKYYTDMPFFLFLLFATAKSTAYPPPWFDPA